MPAAPSLAKSAKFVEMHAIIMSDCGKSKPMLGSRAECAGVSADGPGSLAESAKFFSHILSGCVRLRERRKSIRVRITRIPGALIDCKRCLHRALGRTGCWVLGRDLLAMPGLAKFAKSRGNARVRNRYDYVNHEYPGRGYYLQLPRPVAPVTRGIREVLLGQNFLDTSDYERTGKVLVTGSHAFREHGPIARNACIKAAEAELPGQWALHCWPCPASRNSRDFVRYTHP